MADHVCPVWVGYLLASPLRKLFQNPDRILERHVETGMTVLDVGCAMGFFSLPMARMVGPEGRVICVDMQPRMVEVLIRRATRHGLRDRIDTRLCRPDDLGLGDLSGAVDFALAMAVVHEVPDPTILLAQIARALRPSGRCLLAEPTGHVGAEAFGTTLRNAAAAGLAVIGEPRVPRSRAALLMPE